MDGSYPDLYDFRSAGFEENWLHDSRKYLKIRTVYQGSIEVFSPKPNVFRLKSKLIPKLDVCSTQSSFSLSIVLYSVYAYIDRERVGVITIILNRLPKLMRRYPSWLNRDEGVSDN